VRVAILSDIHGFDLALDVALADIDARGPFDEVIVAGDLCEIGPRPDRVLEEVRRRRFTVLTGNTDRDIVFGARSGVTSDEVAYAIQRIGDDGVEFLARLPFSRRITPSGGVSPDHDLLVFHANPWNLYDRLDPAWDDGELTRLIGIARAHTMAFGHIHICYVRQVGAVQFFDVSAVGNPKDGDLRVKYGIATWDPVAMGWGCEIVRLEYPIEATESQVYECGVPDAERVAQKLRRASYGKRNR
jgi:predicted phosphodiesterase